MNDKPRRIAFFPQSQSENLTSRQALLILLRQLVEELVDLPPYIIDCFSGTRKKALNIFEIKQAFKFTLRLSQETFFVIDEIDAVDDWPEIFDFFSGLGQSSKSRSKLRLLIFNQPNWLLEEKLKSIPHGRINIAEANSADINYFVRSKIRAIDRIARRPHLENSLGGSILPIAQGWFVETKSGSAFPS